MDRGTEELSSRDEEKDEEYEEGEGEGACRIEGGEREGYDSLGQVACEKDCLTIDAVNVDSGYRSEEG